MTAAAPGVLGSGPSPVQSPIQSPVQSPVQSSLQAPPPTGVAGADGGGAQAALGASAIVPVLGQLVTALQALVGVLPGGSVGGGGSGPCSKGGTGAKGAKGAKGAPGGGGNVDPSSVKDKAGTNGLSTASQRGLVEAHRFGLPLVSGKRGGDSGSDHFHGNAIDVGTLAIGSPGSTGGTPRMKAFAEHMRQQGAAGQLDVKYVIADGRIASARGGWSWRPYTYPGKTTAELEQLKQSNRGEYNRLQHFDHVHVSFS